MYEPTVPLPADMPRDLFAAAERCLRARSVETKLASVRELAEARRTGRLTRTQPLSGSPPDLPLEVPGRPARPQLVPPSQLAQRKLNSAAGIAALVHAVAHIEFNAIDLACDAVYRFRDLPDAYYSDWIRVAAEEAHHFSLLQDRLDRLGHGYGDFPAHDGLWQLARQTAQDPLLRMALVPRVTEARGLDVTPGMIRRFAAIGDHETVAVLEVILRDEVGHVEIGTRWFHHLCAQRGLDAEATYFQLLEEHAGSRVRAPLHREARLQAGFTETELDRLEALCRDR
jgi:uncharacterized ferritin-like protein (DUF455 family)